MLAGDASRHSQHTDSDHNLKGLGIMRQALVPSVFSREGSALLLLLGAAAWLSLPDQALAADLSDKTPLFHPLAADLNQLAENVRTPVL